MAERDTVYTGSILRNEFLYRSWDTFQNVLRMEVRLKEPVSDDSLEFAVQESAGRYPYYCKKVIRRGEEYEITLNEAKLPVYKGSGGITLGSEEAHGHYLAAGYEDNRIFFDMYHSMSDAQGMIPWLKTVVYLYIKQKFKICKLN